MMWVAVVSHDSEQAITSMQISGELDGQEALCKLLLQKAENGSMLVLSIHSCG